MDLRLRPKIAEAYKSMSQKARVLSEDWVSRNVYCPNCNCEQIERYDNNEPVADFICEECDEDYELKSAGRPAGTKIVDGEYKTMLRRLKSATNPNFFFLNYHYADLSILNFFVIPKHFFTHRIIEKRNPLAATARRADWVGCNILIKDIPHAGRIFYVRNGFVQKQREVIRTWKKTLFLRGEKSPEEKGWMLDVMKCIEKLDAKAFSIVDVYRFEGELARKHPANNHVKEKIRQQLQILRDREYLEFTRRGEYRLI
ncbi:MAG: restriction endonuclease [Alphaproteobacteria bacterium]|nr:MAG: restriction endonuclease [Alphaproteobacteria bacterium]